MDYISKIIELITALRTETRQDAITPDALLLFRSGYVYKCYEEDAIKAAEVLCLTNIVEEDKITIASFHHHCLDTYLPRLIRHGIRVAICDDITDFVKKSSKKPTEIVAPVQQELFLRS